MMLILQKASFSHWKFLWLKHLRGVSSPVWETWNFLSFSVGRGGRGWVLLLYKSLSKLHFSFCLFCIFVYFVYFCVHVCVHMHNMFHAWLFLCAFCVAFLCVCVGSGSLSLLLSLFTLKSCLREVACLRAGR